MRQEFERHAIRLMGYAYDFEMQQLISSQVDIDGTGTLDQVEFQKMVRMCREREITRMEQAFSEADTAGSVKLSVEVAQAALQSIDVVDFRTGVVKLSGKQAALDIFTFVQEGIRQILSNRHFLREYQGFTAREADDLKQLFDSCDMDGSGTLEKSEMMGAISMLLPEMSSSPLMRPQLLELVKTADIGGDGRLDFHDFLKLLRGAKGLEQKQRGIKEEHAVAKTQFDAPEVQEFRQLFIDSDEDGDRELSLVEFKDMIDIICPMGEQNAAAVETLFKEVSSQQMDVDGSQAMLDFPEFLLLMRRLLDTNLGNICQRTETFLKKRKVQS